MMHKALVILALLSVGCAHAVATEKSGALRLYPIKESELPEPQEGGCDFQLKGTKDPKTKHFIQIAVCFPCSKKGRPAETVGCIPASAININNDQVVLPRTAPGKLEDPVLYKYGDYSVELNIKPREGKDCEKISCEKFPMEAVLTVKMGSQQQTFEMQGSCDIPN